MTATLTAPSSFLEALADVEDDSQNPLVRLERRFVREMLPEIAGLDVLDVCCGSGRWLQLLATLKPGSLTGVDASPRLIQCAEKNLRLAATLRVGSCTSLPLQAGRFDLILASFALGDTDSLQALASELSRVSRPGATVFLTDVHPENAGTHSKNRLSRVTSANRYSLQKITDSFVACGFELRSRVEPCLVPAETTLIKETGGAGSRELLVELPAIYILQFQKKNTVLPRSNNSSETSETLQIHEARFALGPDEATSGSFSIGRGYIQSITTTERHRADKLPTKSISLPGYLLLPGLINAHDHLELGLFPNLGAGPYQNSIEWTKEIHRTHGALIARQRKVPKAVRLLWGALRNLISGVTTVCHHNPLSRELLSPDFPIRVLSKYGWAHSLEMDPNLLHNFDHTPSSLPFVLHAAEGVDAKSAQEIFDLDRMQVLDARTVLVHGLALDAKAAALLNRRRSALVICPTSNQFLFHCVPSRSLIKSLNTVILGSDSPLTASGDLLNEISFARNEIGLDCNSIYKMVTDRSANVLRLRNGEGRLKPGAIADMIAVKDKGLSPAETVAQLSFDQVELVILAGQVQLASASLYDRLPESMRLGLQSLVVDGQLRWLRAPVDHLLSEARKVLGRDIRLGGKKVDHAGTA